MSDRTKHQLDIIAQYVDLSERTECEECGGTGTVTVATKRGRHYRNSTGPGLEDRPCPEDCDDGWYTLREWGAKHGVHELLEHPSVYGEMTHDEMESAWSSLQEVPE